MRSALALILALAGCTGSPTLDEEDLSITKVEPGKEDSSAEAVFLLFTFDGELITGSSWNPERQIENQLLYTIGHLNGDRAVGRLDKVELSNVTTESVEGGTRVLYTATLPVAWGRREAIPSNYTFQLPRDMRYDALDSFAETYGHTCVDWGAHDVDSGSMWYYYRPERSGCSLAADDVVEFVADIAPSPAQTTGRFPEYDEVWRDGLFQVTAVFGKYEDGATTSSDAGVAGYGRFVEELARILQPHDLVMTPEVSGRPGVEHPEVRFEATLDSGHRVDVVAILVDNVRTAGAAFDQRYAELSTSSDLIIYNGHAGLGANIRALAQKGRWTAGQYAIVFMNGCDTYAYVDSALWDAHAAVNGDDPEGTKYLDLISNALPSYFRSMPRATLALIEGLMDWENPTTYEQIFADVDSSQVVLVSGEHDNDYIPGGGGEEPPPPSWTGLSETGAVARGEQVRFSTPTLTAGHYVFEMTGQGDADLYVRIGAEPSKTHFDCRPYRANSNERCEIELAGDAPVHVMIDGYSAAEFSLTGARREF